MVTAASNEMTWSALAAALATCVHKVPALANVPIYADVQQHVPSLPAVFITPINTVETLAFGTRRIFDWPVQIMVSFGENVTNLTTTAADYALAIMDELEYIPWGVTGVTATDSRSWQLTGTDLVISLTIRIHRKLTKE